MIIDTSALIAILLAEEDASTYIDALSNADTRLLSVFNALEAGVVILARKGRPGLRELDLLLHEASIDQVALDADQVAIARSAYQKYGKGRHPAGLNLGDCCAYALAARSGEPLLFKGDDFGQTDIPSAL